MTVGLNERELVFTVDINWFEDPLSYITQMSTTCYFISVETMPSRQIIISLKL